jgi:ribosomal protein S27E
MDPEHISTILPSVLKRIREERNMDKTESGLSQPKIVTCNMCGNEWPHYGRDDNKIKCPICGSNESFSIR